MTVKLTQLINSQDSETQNSEPEKFLSPWDQTPLAHWSPADEMDVIRCLQSSKKFLNQPNAWAKEDRLALLERLKTSIEKNIDDWASQEALYQGLPFIFTKESSFQHVLHLIDQNKQALQQKASDHYLNTPSGVVAIITSWSLSFRLVMESLIPAWAAGNSAIIKVSSKSPITALILKVLIEEIKPPVGSIQVLLGVGSKVGAFLAAHPGVRAVSFVGRTKNAESVIQSTAQQFKKLKIRGSVKNSALILPGFESEAHWDRLVESFLIGQGQTGWSMSRLLTTEAEAPKIIERLKEKVLKIKPARSIQDRSPWGPGLRQSLKNEALRWAQEEHGQAFAPESEGAQFLLNLPNCSNLQQDELLVPVFPIVTVKYLHELAKWANNTSYGNLAVLWGDEDKARKMADKLEFGALWLNHWMRPEDKSPWGLKQSAFGIGDDQAEGPFFSDKKLTL